MKEHLKASIFPAIIVALFALAACIGVSTGQAHKEIAHDVKYENYCDSIWYCDRDYYLDVLIETDEYNQYIEKHGEWWNN